MSRKPRAGTVAGMGDLRYPRQRASLHIDFITLFEKAPKEYIFLGNFAPEKRISFEGEIFHK